MARLPRYGVPGQPQHLIQRGNNRSPIFFAPEDYGFYFSFSHCTPFLQACRFRPSNGRPPRFQSADHKHFI